MSDLDGNLQDRSSTVSVFNGPIPSIQVLKTEREEIDTVSQWISDRAREGVVAHEFGIFVRSPAQLSRARAAVEKAGIPFKILDEGVEATSTYASISTMHLAKGLEFRAVVVMACDDEVIPSQERIETVGDDSDLQEVYDTERHLFTSLALERETICLSLASNRYPSSWMIFERNFHYLYRTNK